MTADRTDVDPGYPPEKTRLYLASWDDRFVAWLIDLLLVGAVLSAFGEFGNLFSVVSDGLFVSIPFVGVNGAGVWAYGVFSKGIRASRPGR